MKSKKTSYFGGDVLVFENDYYSDKRGHLWTSYNKKILKNVDFFHDKFSVSKKNVFRGLHYDFKTSKLITCVVGKIFFIIVDMRKRSKNFLKFKTWILSEKKKISIMIPPGFANGHYVLSDYCCFNYKLAYNGTYNDHDKQYTLKWYDQRLNKIKWPFKAPIVSLRDK